jgi:hypothetical protein
VTTPFNDLSPRQHSACSPAMSRVKVTSCSIALSTYRQAGLTRISDTDDDLVRQMQEAGTGDLRAFETLVKRHQTKVVANCRHFGLGSRDITRNVLAGFYARKILQVGERLEIGGQAGVLRSITATHAILEHEDQSISVANAAILDQVAKQSHPQTM